MPNINIQVIDSNLYFTVQLYIICTCPYNKLLTYIKQYMYIDLDFFQYDLRALVFQLSPCIIRHSRGRHKVVKKKSRGNGYQLYKYTCANTSDSCSSKDKPFGRSRTQVTKFGKTTKTEASRKMSSASC